MDNDDLPEPDFDYNDENVIEDCPNCGREYDDIDIDFLICHHCGWDAEEKRFKANSKSRSIKGYGIDPEVKLDDWS